MFNDTRINVVTSIYNDFYQVTSTTCMFNSSVWLERELSEFTGILFSGLIDSRRLLSDYCGEKAAVKTHINNDKVFNNVFYDILLSF